MLLQGISEAKEKHQKPGIADIIYIFALLLYLCFAFISLLFDVLEIISSINQLMMS